MKIEIPIEQSALKKMFIYAYYAEKHFGTEIAGWGHYRKDKGIYKLAPLSSQEVKGAEVDNFPDDIINNVHYNMSDMIVQWHSHVNMSTFFSSTDIANITKTLKLFPAIISIIVNCKNQYSARLDIAETNIFDFDEIVNFDVTLKPYYQDEKISEEVKTKLHKPIFPTPVMVAPYTGYKDRPPYYFSEFGFENGYQNIGGNTIPPKNEESSVSEVLTVEKCKKWMEEFTALYPDTLVYNDKVCMIIDTLNGTNIMLKEDTRNSVYFDYCGTLGDESLWEEFKVDFLDSYNDIMNIVEKGNKINGSEDKNIQQP
jgi:proteasome lid subunit RPN8/RPN11